MSEEDYHPERQLESVHLEPGTIVSDSDHKDKQWKTIKEIGRGAFGTVYHVINQSRTKEAALKIERITDGENLLKIEREIMEAMQKEPTAIHIYDDGVYNEYRFIVMTLCGLDLEKIAILMNNKFSQETIIRVCIRTLLAIKTLHEYCYIHRDLKPCNFAVDFDIHSLHVYIFDYGMARKYVRRDNGNTYMRRGREQVQFRGTVRYCSLNMHRRRELGRVDDVWSWFFMLMEMHAPLPWGGITHPDKVEAFKEERLIPYLEKDPFFRSLLPIVTMLNGTKYAGRPKYLEMYELLYAKLREINGKLSGPMEYDKVRIAAQVSELGDVGVFNEIIHHNQKLPGSKVQHEEIPDGENFLVPETFNFFGSLDPLKAKEEKTDENRKKRQSHVHKKEHDKRQSNVNKMMGIKKQPNSGGKPNEKQSSSAGSKTLPQSKVKKVKDKKPH
ncbi:hypothetical protein CAEBREN_30608 [Caenorhabditis brenneri]|uniref:Protein kinase domain-containing protein n=1 Tax=Caenorhabditis brenneri TaxID=135651 RepID=G0NQ21_CAEBE|nr:hypothetical protein CAEBREN_30608 [Caenorhabditis brenneri]